MTYEDALWIARFHRRVMDVRPACMISRMAYWRARAVIARHRGHTQGIARARRELAPLNRVALEGVAL